MRVFEIGIVLIILFGITAVQNSNAQFCSLELNYEIDGGELTSVCSYYEEYSMTLSIEPTIDGEITIEIPRIEVDALIGCEDDKFFVFLDETESDYKEVDTSPIIRTLQINFTSTTSTIKILGVGVPEAFGYEHVVKCIEQRLQEIPPKQQMKIGVDFDGVVCKEGLEKILKINDDSAACVSPETAQKLVEREWGKFPRF